MLTPSQVAQRANVTSRTIRNYSDWYGSLLSVEARGETGPRLYNDEDVETLCTIAALRKGGVPPNEIIERIRNSEVPPIIDVTPETPLNQAKEPLNAGQEDFLAPQLAYTHLQIRFESIERRLQDHMVELRVELRQRHNADKLWYIGMGIWIGLVTAGVILGVMWLLVNGATQ